jgi:hypothetical protein
LQQLGSLFDHLLGLFFVGLPQCHERTWYPPDEKSQGRFAVPGVAWRQPHVILDFP